MNLVSPFTISGPMMDTVDKCHRAVRIRGKRTARAITPGVPRLLICNLGTPYLFLVRLWLSPGLVPAQDAFQGRFKLFDERRTPQRRPVRS